MEKSILRSSLAGAFPSATSEAGLRGRLAEKLRREPAYRQARQVFVTPAAILNQVRINTLLDNKDLVMPGAGLREGFFLVKPFTVPFRELAKAVSVHGPSQYGKRLAIEELAGLAIDLLVTDALAVDESGYLLGDGHGFFDLAVALLAAHGALAEQVTILAVTVDGPLVGNRMSPDPWDVRVDGVVTAEGFVFFPDRPPGMPVIHWESLSLDRVRRIDPLWKLYEKKYNETPS